MKPLALSVMVCAGFGVGASGASGAPAAFRGLRGPPGTLVARAAGISADGSTVVGYWQSRLDAPAAAVRWSVSGGRPVNMGRAGPGLDTRATGVSADGSVIAGTTRGPGGATGAFWWTEENGAKRFTAQAGAAHGAAASGVVVAGDGAVFGTASIGRAPARAVRIAPDGRAIDMGALAGGQGLSTINGVNLGGNVLVGMSTGASGWRAVREVNGQKMRPLGLLPNSTESSATACTPDGSVVVGQSGRAFRWTEASGMIELGVLSGANDSRALGVSASGQTIVGQSGDRAFIWTPARGMRDLGEVLGSRGADVRGWTLLTAVGISSDGRTIVGNGISPAKKREAWVATLPPCRADTDGSGALTAADLVAFSNLWIAQDPRADFNGDGRVDGRDLVQHASAYFAGCE